MQPSVGVVTPYYMEDYQTLERCIRSVSTQDYRPVSHLMVADGNPHPGLAGALGIEHMSLPYRHEDAGATPRAIGALSMLSRGFDAVAFLDADNTFCENHVRLMVDLMFSTKSDVVTATRNICRINGRTMYVDNIESNGEDFCDTNCLFIGRSCLHLLTYWVTDPSIRLWSDRQFWAAIKGSGARRQHCKIPTVNYHSKWAWHYQQAGLEPPADSVWIDTTGGRLVHSKHQESRGNNR